MRIFDLIFALFKKSRGIFSLLFCITISLSLLFMDLEGKKVFYEVMVATILLPVESVVSLNKGYFNVYQENKRLLIENADLLVKNERLRQNKKQNDRLRKMLEFKTESGYRLIAGEIVARDPGRYEMTWILSLGKKDSIEMNMPVLTPKGVVGKVAKVFSGYSVIQLIQDPNCKISIINQRSRVIGLLETFQLGKLIARFPAHSNVKAGDTLITSGMGGVFPKGLPVGMLINENLDSDDIITGAEVRLFQDTDIVEELFVYVKKANWKVGLGP
ncbi:MAG: rod shape-determining protein MreC [Fibrobacteria bacterium]|nr:rod shape-determining protein MreC [Fibrobacteria bacterium]